MYCMQILSAPAQLALTGGAEFSPVRDAMSTFDVFRSAIDANFR
jgi:hypothetical protein